MLNNVKFIYGFLALSYLLTISISPHQYSFIHKALPIVILLIVALKRLRGQSRMFVASALFLSAVGDVLLALNLQQSFLFGLAAFAAAHLCYTACFFQWRKWHNRHFIGLSLLGAYMLCILALLLPVTETLQIPLVSYLLIIGLMACSAILVDSPDRLILLGAALFVLSDSLLAWHKFLSPVPYESVLVMLSYYSAQYFLLEGCISKQGSNALT
jgi:uncharacterized membrane protein YhhN